MFSPPHTGRITSYLQATPNDETYKPASLRGLEFLFAGTLACAMTFDSRSWNERAATSATRSAKALSVKSSALPVSLPVMIAAHYDCVDRLSKRVFKRSHQSVSVRTFIVFFGASLRAFATSFTCSSAWSSRSASGVGPVSS